MQKTFNDLKDGDIVYIIHPEYDVDGDFVHWIIEEIKIKSIFTYMRFLDGSECLEITLENGYYFKPMADDVYHSGGPDEEGAGRIAEPRVEYFVDLKYIKMIFDYKYVLKEMDIKSIEKYNLY